MMKNAVSRKPSNIFFLDYSGPYKRSCMVDATHDFKFKYKTTT